MIGDSANGRSTSALSKDLPGNRWRTSTHDVMTPKNVVTISVMTVMTPVRKKACWTSGRWKVSKTVWSPGSSAVQMMPINGSSSRTPTYRKQTATMPLRTSRRLAVPGFACSTIGSAVLQRRAHRVSSLRRSSLPVASTSTKDRANRIVATAAASTGLN